VLGVSQCVGVSAAVCADCWKEVLSGSLCLVYLHVVISRVYISFVECVTVCWGIGSLCRLLVGGPFVFFGFSLSACMYGVAPSSRLLKISGLFCRISSL